MVEFFFSKICAITFAFRLISSYAKSSIMKNALDVLHFQLDNEVIYIFIGNALEIHKSTCIKYHFEFYSNSYKHGRWSRKPEHRR